MNSTLNNALNLFPTTTTPPQTQAKLQRLLYSTYTESRGPSEIQSTLAYSLYDDAVQYMSTLAMNRAASYTFGHRNSYGQNGTTLNNLGGGTHGESVADEMWELVVDLTLSKFTQHSVMALTKTINLIQHVLLHGSESCVMNGQLLYKIEMAVEPLRNLNTALVEQQMVEQILNNNSENDVVLTADGIGHQLAQFGTRATATMLKLRGGSVDKGHPVRVAASKLYGIVSVPNNLRQCRNSGVNGSSLVPIGSAKQVGYITDEGRYQLLQEKMAAEERTQKQKEWQEQQRLKQTRSNLAGTSAVDSFGGGYASNGGKVVVGAAHSLEDMIKSAKYELEHHKDKREQKMSTLKKGYSDDPYTRAQKLAELERINVESDPEFIKKEKALKDALEYLEEMKKLEEEKVGDLLEGDLLGAAATMSSTVGGNSSANGGMSCDYGADLLGFDNNPPTTSSTHIFGGAVPPSAMTGTMAGGGGVSADLLGFDGLTTGSFSAHPAPMTSGGIMGVNTLENTNNFENNAATMGGGGIMGNNANFDMRPSLVTGMRGDTGNIPSNPAFMGEPVSQPASAAPNFPGAENGVSTMGVMGGAQGTPISSLQPELDEEAEAENSRKMTMAAGLFAGVVPNGSSNTSQRNQIMQSGNNSNISALDELIPTSDAPLAPISAVASQPSSSPMQSSDPLFGMGPMGGSSNGNSTGI
ncbi:hypothetical protein ACHAXR_003232, partial [Thalassiosira sp. AJA248-18]